MILLTKEILTAFKRQGDTSEMHPTDIKIICKLFNPSGVGTWYLYEYDPSTEIAYGFCQLADPSLAECGTVSLVELKDLKCPPFGLGIERDMYFPVAKKSLAEIIKQVQG